MQPGQAPGWFGRTGWWRAIAFAALGAVLALMQAPYQIPLVAPPILAIVLYLVPRLPRPKEAALVGWAFGAGYFAHALSWIVEPFLVDIARHGWMAPFALVLMSVGAGLFWAVGFGVARRIAGGRWRGPLALAACWAGVEALRGLIFTGFPWADVAQGMMDTPVAFGLPVVGPRGVGLAVLVGLALLGGALWRRPRALVLGAGMIGAALWVLPGPGAVGDLDGPVVRLVQPNAPQHQKWDPAYAPGFVDRQVGYSEAPPVAGAPAPALIVWPEMSVPYHLDGAQDVLDRVSEAGQGAPVILGLPRLEGLRYFNTLAMVGRGGQVIGRYDKAHLVPFGEYMPFGGLLARVGIRGLAVDEGGGYSAGAPGALISIPGVGVARPLICYEGIFPEEVRTMAQRPRLLLMITNDAWFGDRAGPYQHLIQARMRALETGLPMVRVSNTGISAMIDAHGVVTEKLPLGVAGWVDAPLPSALPLTIYAKWGDIPAAIGLLLVLLGVISGRVVFPVDGRRERL